MGTVFSFSRWMLLVPITHQLAMEIGMKTMGVWGFLSRMLKELYDVRKWMMNRTQIRDRNTTAWRRCLKIVCQNQYEEVIRCIKRSLFY